jgi:Ca2+-binding RTX toxin-like protein
MSVLEGDNNPRFGLDFIDDWKVNGTFSVGTTTTNIITYFQRQSSYDSSQHELIGNFEYTVDPVTGDVVAIEGEITQIKIRFNFQVGDGMEGETHFTSYIITGINLDISVLEAGGASEEIAAIILSGDDQLTRVDTDLGYEDLSNSIGWLFGYAGNDTITGSEMNEGLDGGIGNDTIDGQFGSDILYGRRGDDILSGGNGHDKLFGGIGKDYLRGGYGADQFIYSITKDSSLTSAGRDIILDFARTQGDKIDLSAIDADTTNSGNQAFNFIERAAFSSTAGELRFGITGGKTILSGDVDGDGASDFRIELDRSLSFIANDLLL